MKDETKISATLIFEIIGRPKDHLVETLKDIIKKMGEEKGVEVKSNDIKDPTELKDKKDFFTTFAEADIEAENLMYIVMLIFKYMPAHVEIVSPERISLRNNDWGEVLSELVRRLHGYDEIARVLQNEKMVLEKKLKEAVKGK